MASGLELNREWVRGRFGGTVGDGMKCRKKMKVKVRRVQWCERNAGYECVAKEERISDDSRALYLERRSRGKNWKWTDFRPEKI